MKQPSTTLVCKRPPLLDSLNITAFQQTMIRRAATAGIVIVLLLNPISCFTPIISNTFHKPISHSSTATTLSSSSLDNDWESMYAQLLHFKSLHNHTIVPSLYTPNPELGKWVQQQRQYHQNLPIIKRQDPSHQQHVARLNAIGFVWNVRKFRWMRMYDELLRHRRKNDGSLDDIGGKLGQWCSKQRRSYHSGTLLRSRISLLKKINFPFETKVGMKNQMWTRRFDELCDYRCRNGDCNVPLPYESNPSLGVWVSNQRRQYKNYVEGKNYTTITRERIEALEGLGFTWQLADDVWKERLDELADYEAVHGDCLVPQNYEQNKVLASWVANQRTNYRYWRQGLKSGLTKEKIEALDALGFCWSKNDLVWYGMLDRLKDFRGKNDTWDVPEEEGELRFWVMYQRNERRKLMHGRTSHLNPTRIRALDDIGFVWDGPVGRRGIRDDVGTGPTTEDWGKLFEEMRERGIDPKAKPKEHWFDGMDRFGEVEEKDLMSLWNEEEDDW